MATIPHHDAHRRGTMLHLPVRAQRIAPKAGHKVDTRPTHAQRMIFIFGASTMLWVGIAALAHAL